METIGKIFFPLIRGVCILKSLAVLVLFRKFITFIPIFEVVKVSGRHQGLFGQRKERKK